MSRFLIFPLVLAAVAAPFPQLTYLEALFPMVMFDGNPSHFITISVTLSDLSYIWDIAARYSVAIGFVLGLGMAFFSWFLGRGRPRSVSDIASKLLANLWWCGFYVTLLCAFNALLALGVAKAFPAHVQWPASPFLPWFVVAVLNLSAVLWASIRSITQNDVLSPRVLSRNLKRSTRLVD